MISRRSFLATSSLAFLGLQRYVHAETPSRVIDPLGPLLPDPARVIDLPPGFTYRILARMGEPMSDGFKTPGAPDGMAAFAQPDGNLVLVCNHEIGLKAAKLGPFEDTARFPAAINPALCYDPGDAGQLPHVGGTSNIVFDPRSGKTLSHFLSLTGTDRNCAGGPMPWNAWITCEEPEELTSQRGLKHGWCFEVKATATPGLQTPTALKALGRFRHEAVALDPATGILYLTEDRTDGLLYRFLPTVKNDLSAGKLQALAIIGRDSADLRNYRPSATFPVEGEKLRVRWIDLEDIDSPKDDLRKRGFQAGAARFARGEGIHLVGTSLYICCTDGGPTHRGQLFKLDPAPTAEGEDALTLFIQSQENDLLTNADNLCPAPWGGVVICEDLVNAKLSPAAHVRSVTPEGKIFTIARNPRKGEFAGGCFSPDGKWFFVNIMAEGLVLAITGPWEKATTA